MKNGPLTEIDKVLMGVRYSRQKALASMDGCRGILVTTCY